MYVHPDALLRLPEIIGRPATATSPAIPGLIPVKRSSWWAGVKAGRYPKPIRIGARSVAWRASDIAALRVQMEAVVVGEAA